MGITNPLSMDHSELVTRDELLNGSGPIDLKQQVAFQSDKYVVIGDEVFLVDDLEELVKNNPPEKSPGLHVLVEKAFIDLKLFQIAKGGK